MAFDVIIVGSGFGGAVSAARLAERGLGVLILERGPWWGPLQADRPAPDRRPVPRGLRGLARLLRGVRVARNERRFERVLRPDGLLEVHLFDRLGAITASGVGGGSLVYTSILDEPDADFWDVFPPEITAAELRPYFDRVRAMLRPSPIPDRPEKNRIFDAAVRAAGLGAPVYPDLAVAWGADPAHPEPVTNAAGVGQSTSTWKSDCFVGSDDGSKTTLDLTYVPRALAAGAELRPLCEVLAVGEGGPGYRVRYLDHRTGARREEAAPRLVLAAGGLNTQRLLFAARRLLRSLPRVTDRLGRGFSPNGDLAGLVWRSPRLRDSSVGTSFNAFTRIEDRGRLRFVLGEVTLPVEALPLPRRVAAALRRSTGLIAMGRDAGGGTLHFDGRGLVTDAGRGLDRALFSEVEDAMARLARTYDPRAVVLNLPWGRGREGLFTVHPLGGCAMGRDPEAGVTDHLGQVFGHPGLYVADGSLYPAAPGIAPSLTIAALAERQAALMG